MKIKRRVDIIIFDEANNLNICLTEVKRIKDQEFDDGLI